MPGREGNKLPGRGFAWGRGAGRKWRRRFMEAAGADALLECGEKTGRGAGLSCGSMKRLRHRMIKGS